MSADIAAERGRRAYRLDMLNEIVLRPMVPGRRSLDGTAPKVGDVDSGHVVCSASSWGQGGAKIWEVGGHIPRTEKRELDYPFTRHVNRICTLIMLCLPSLSAVRQ